MGNFAHTIPDFKPAVRKALAEVLREADDAEFTSTHALAEFLHPQVDRDLEAAEQAKIHADAAKGRIVEPRRPE